MKTRIASLLCLSLYLPVTAAFGQYTYDYNMNTSSPGANWNSNGVVTISSGVDSFNWGSLILIPGVPTVNSSDLPVPGTSRTITKSTPRSPSKPARPEPTSSSSGQIPPRCSRGPATTSR